MVAKIRRERVHGRKREEGGKDLRRCILPHCREMFAAHLLPSERERNRKLQLIRADTFCPAPRRCCRPPASELSGRALFPLKNGSSCRSKSTEQISTSGEGRRKAEQCIQALRDGKLSR